MAAKRTRRKSYKNMSVSELVKAKEELQSQMTEIDEILGQAVEAFSVSPTTGLPIGAAVPRPLGIKGDPAFAPSRGAYAVPSNTQNISVAPQPSEFSRGMGAEYAPQVKVNPNNPNVESPFSIFDADSWARQQAEASKQSEAAQGSVQEYDIPNMEAEVASLKEQISEKLSDAENTDSTSGSGEGSEPPASE